MLNNFTLKLLQQPTPEEREVIRKQIIMFSKAIVNKDLTTLEPLLHEEFLYFDTKSKWETLDYFKKQFENEMQFKTMSDDVGLFFCMRCQPGNPALMFNDGYFPSLEDGLNSRKAIAIEFKNGKISDLTLCFGFCNANKLHEIATQN